MASTELLKMTRSVDDKVTDVNNRVKGVEEKVQDVRGDVHDVRDDVEDVGNKVQGVDDRVQDISRVVDDKFDQVNSSLSLTPAHRPKDLDSFTGNYLRDSLLRWLSPPDPSVNHNAACKAHHDGTAQWFFQGSIFNQWKSTDPFLWIHGKRVIHLTFIM